MKVRLGGTTVDIRSASSLVLATAAAFYPAISTSDADWTVVAIPDSPPAGVPRNPFGVGFVADLATRSVNLWSTDAQSLAITTRKCVRETFLHQCEQHRYTMLHASAIRRDGHVVVFAADKRGGKTTLALRAVLDHGWQWLSNDHLILYPTPTGGLTATSLPTTIPVKVGTLVDLWDRLPQPWDFNGVDVSWWQTRPAAERYASDAGAYFTFASFGQANPVQAPLKARHVTVVFPRYADAHEPTHLEPVTTGDAAAELARHIRTDWVGDDRLNQRHLPFRTRDLATFAADGAAYAAQLAATAQALRWTHRGDPAPLLTVLNGATR